MPSATPPCNMEALQQENAQLQQRIRDLEQRLASLRAPSSSTSASSNLQPAISSAPPGTLPGFITQHGLTKPQVERYSRQLLLPAFGVDAQDRLCHGSCLIIGCGGLGSPAALYLAAAGVGRLGLVDHDHVDLSNLHRQIIHSEARVGTHKASSAAAAVQALNSTIQVDLHLDGFYPHNAVDIVPQYDVVIDASDNPTTRYLINDACIACSKPLVSAAAVGTDGQLTVYGYGSQGPCYRCLYPVSPLPENCSRCADAGVLGPVPGVMGVLQAIEAIKILSGVGEVLSQKLVLYDALAARFMTVKLRSKVDSCLACGLQPAICKDTVASYDYVGFTGQAAHDGPMQPLQLLGSHQRITPGQLQQLLEVDQVAGATAQQPPPAGPAKAGGPGKAPHNSSGQQDAGAPSSSSNTSSSTSATASGPGLPPLLLDVRPKEQFAVMALPGAVNVPYNKFDQYLPQLLAAARGAPGGTAVDAGDSSSSAAVAAAGEGPGLQQQQGTSLGAAAGVPDATAASGQQPPQQQQHLGEGQAQGQRRQVIVLCRRGNDSQRAAARLVAAGLSDVVDVVGGYQAWAAEVDPSMPVL